MRNLYHTMQNYYDCINYIKTMKVHFPSRSCSVNNVVASFFIHSFSFIKKLPNLKTITSHWHTDDWRVFENPVVQTNTFWMSQVCQASLYLRFDCSSQFWGSHLCDHIQLVTKQFNLRPLNKESLQNLKIHVFPSAFSCCLCPCGKQPELPMNVLPHM